MKPTPQMRVLARYKTALCRRVAGSRRFVISCAWSGITLGKGSSPLSAWTDADSLLPKAPTRSRRDRASLVYLTARVVAAARQSAAAITKAHDGDESNIEDENALVEVVEALDRHEKNSPGVGLSAHRLITRDLLERLMETCQDWVGENEWRRGTTPKNIRLLAEVEQAISEAKGLIGP